MNDIELTNTMKFQSKKYMNCCTLLGVNIGFFSYHLLKFRLYWYVAMPIGYGIYFFSRNTLMKNCIDRIYYPLEGVYNKLRNLENPDKNKQVNEEVKKKKEISKEDLAK